MSVGAFFPESAKKRPQTSTVYKCKYDLLSLYK